MSEQVGLHDNGKSNVEGFMHTLSDVLSLGVALIDTATSWQVTQRGAGANMSVDIATGSGYINDSSFNYPAWSTATVNKTVTTANPTNPRIDIVVAYLDQAVPSTAVTNNTGALKFAVVAGTPAASPTAPNSATIQAAVTAGNPWIYLAQIAVAASAATIVNANITDKRQPVSFRGYLWGGTSNTYGHKAPNSADDTLMLLNTAQSPTNLTISGATNIVRSGGANTVLRDSNNQKIDIEQSRTDFGLNYIASGCVWTADAAGSTLLASMTSGVVYISGRRLTVATVTGRAFTASRDTYVDFQDNGDGTATITYTTATNNAASPVLPAAGTDANTIRCAIIVTGAGNIAAAASINQGQEDRVLPIASSIPYAVTDSLGYLICPRDPVRKLLGYRQILSTFTITVTQQTAQQVTGLSCPVMIPTGRKVKVTIVGSMSSGAVSNVEVSIWDGVVNVGTRLNVATAVSPTAGYDYPCIVESINTPSSTTKTYNVSLRNTLANNASLEAAATQPAFIKVELE